MPLRAKASAITANGRCPNNSSSRFCCPLPVTRSTTGVSLVQLAGVQSVPPKRKPAFSKLTSSCLYGKGATGVCGLRTSCAPRFSVSGSCSAPCANVPLMQSPSILPSNVAPIIATVTFIVPSSATLFCAGISFAPCAGESSVQPSAEKLNTSGSFVPITLRSPLHAPCCAQAVEQQIESSAAAKVFVILISR